MPIDSRHDVSDESVRQLVHLPTDRVLKLRGSGMNEIASALAGVGPTCPASITYQAATHPTSVSVVAAILDEMQSTAIGLFPAWLPEAAEIRAAGGAGLAAVRVLASARATRSAHFGPFLSDLAAMALTGAGSSSRRFSPEIRALGLSRVIGESLGREGLVLLVNVPVGLDAYAEQALVAGVEWLADRGALGVWLTGAELVTVDWLPEVVLPSPSKPATVISTVIGKPHPGSAIEAMLEAALARHAWAAGRVWNQPYQSHALMNPVRLDLMWPEHWCVVEIDGPGHCRPDQFEADRQRDVLLQLDGYAVLRFTNARVRYDVEAVVRQISAFIKSRNEPPKGTRYGK